MIFVLIAGLVHARSRCSRCNRRGASRCSPSSGPWRSIGVTLALARFGALHRAGGYLYIGMGWIVVIALPAVVHVAGPVRAAAALRRRRALHRRGDRAAAAAAEPASAGVRVPRGVARDDRRRRGVPLHPGGHARPRLTRASTRLRRATERVRRVAMQSRALSRLPRGGAPIAYHERCGSALRRARRRRAGRVPRLRRLVASGRPTPARRSSCARPTPSGASSPRPTSSGSGAPTSPASSRSTATSST